VLRFKFNPKKSIQAGAYLLQLNGGDMDKYLWIKMLYWADREALKKWEEPITGDNPTSMVYGPVLSAIYDLTKGARQDLRSFWEEFISDADSENRITLKNDPGIEELSRAEIAILNATFDKFKNFGFRQTKDFFSELPEHEDIKAGSQPLPIERILKALGKSETEIHEAEAACKEMRMAEMLLGPG
jgi:hypothetical protein